MRSTRRGEEQSTAGKQAGRRSGLGYGYCTVIEVGIKSRHGVRFNFARRALSEHEEVEAAKNDSYRPSNVPTYENKSRKHIQRKTSPHPPPSRRPRPRSYPHPLFFPLFTSAPQRPACCPPEVQPTYPPLHTPCDVPTCPLLPPSPLLSSSPSLLLNDTRFSPPQKNPFLPPSPSPPPPFLTSVPQSTAYLLPPFFLPLHPPPTANFPSHLPPPPPHSSPPPPPHLCPSTTRTLASTSVSKAFSVCAPSAASEGVTSVRAAAVAASFDRSIASWW